MSKKSIAKANGLKSTFKIGNDEYFMTSFGKGNKAQKEKHIKNTDVKDIHKTFTAVVKNEQQTTINGVTGIATDVQMPTKDNNQLQAKSVIEEIFFGQAFDDNIHIQIAYNVMDIKKLFSVYANNIIYTVNNLLRMDYDEDFVGVFGTMNNLQEAQIAYEICQTHLIKKDRGNSEYYFIDMPIWYEEKDKKLLALNKLVKKYSDRNLKYFQNISNCIVNQLGFSRLKYIENTAKSFESIKKFGLDKCANYFSDVFADKDGNINLDYIYECLRLLGTMRQTAFHSDDFKDEVSRISNTYTLFEIDKKAAKETRTILNAITKNKIDAINDNFIKTSTVNFNILFASFPYDDKNSLIKKYYDYAVRKAHKNIGFSVKTLREMILAEEQDTKRLSDKEYDSVRQKLYNLFDFSIYTYYLSNEAAALNFINSLRKLNVSKNEDSTLEDKKAVLYKEEAKKLWSEIKDTVLNHIITGIDKCKAKGGISSLQIQIDKNFEEELKSAVQNSSELSYFTKAIYCICAFLDGKEINMFLDSLINSFDNIVSLIETYKGIMSLTQKSESANIEIKFSDNYDFFNHCEQYADELRFIKSIARMNKGKKATKDSKVNIKGFQYYDAAAVFGETDKDRIDKLFRLNERTTKEHKVDHTLRNFFINNVINSNRYNYVIRFINPSAINRIMKNQALVSYAIHEIDDKQIIRYCEATQISYNAKNPDLTEMRKALTDKLLKVNFETFAKISNNREEAMEKERLKSLVGLYLTIDYLITKSLVRINTSYSIAFSIFERDCMIMDRKANSESDENSCLIKGISFKNKESNYFGLTEYFIKNNKVNDRVKNLAIRNKKNHYNDDTFRFFRNNVEHLAVISRFPNYVDDIKKVDSYFDLYHYLMLRILKEGDGKNSSIKNEFTSEFIDSALYYQSAWKDFLYGILAPFAYNPARYINLACKKKFIEGYGK